MRREKSEKTVNLPALFFEDLAVGQSASIVRRVSSIDIAGYVDLPGIAQDDEPGKTTNPIIPDTHLRFGQSIDHGVFTAGLITTVISTRLPGGNGVYLSQTFQYIAPVQLGDVVTGRVEIMELIYSRRRARLFCECLRKGAPILEGEAWIAVMSRYERPG